MLTKKRLEVAAKSVIRKNCFDTVEDLKNWWNKVTELYIWNGVYHEKATSDEIEKVKKQTFKIYEREN
jgi:hypothetical protein